MKDEKEADFKVGDKQFTAELTLAISTITLLLVTGNSK